jgi:hypothetical protein
MSLWSEFLSNQQRPIHKWTHYFSIYERHFGHLRNQPIKFLEIGCGQGGSLQMWKRWLGPRATIVGLDKRAECRAFEEDQIHVRIGNQSDPVFLGELVKEFGAFDAILDDGSHIMSDVSASFGALYPTMSNCGIYMIEDMHTAYLAEYGGGLKSEGSFIEHTKSLVDRLNAERSRGQMQPDKFSSQTWSIHFYEGVIVFERGPRVPTQPRMVGTKSDAAPS